MTTTTRPDSPFPPGNGSAEAGLNTAASRVHDVVDKMAVAADGAVSTVKPVLERATQLAHQTVDKVTAVALPTADWLSATGERLNETRLKAVAETGAYVSAHPWRSLGFALAAGYVISRILR